MDQSQNSTVTGIRRSKQRPRQLGVVLSGNTFALKDLEDCNSDQDIPIPKLPIAFHSSSSGFVRERALLYQRQLDRDSNRERRVTSTASSEAGSVIRYV